MLGIVGRALTGIRGAKTAAKASQRRSSTRAVIAGPDARDRGDRVSRRTTCARWDRIADLRFASADELAVTDILLRPGPETEEAR